MTRVTLPVYILAASVVVVVVLIGGLVMLNEHHNDSINRINRAQCASLTNLYVVIRKTLADADAAIDEIDYYREHPAERERAHERNRETRERFRKPPCPENTQIGGRP